MIVAKWGNCLAVRLPSKLVRELGLKAGDQVELSRQGDKQLAISKAEQRADAIGRMRERGWKMPPDYKFDREEANRR